MFLKKSFVFHLIVIKNIIIWRVFLFCFTADCVITYLLKLDNVLKGLLILI